MAIFQIQKGNTLIAIEENKIDLEKDIQKITEDNLETIFGLKFVSSEFPLNTLRIDSLAFDQETQSFVIIEYKRDRSFSVIDQGYAYLSLMLNNKADFILEYNEKMKDSLSRDKVDWSQSKVIFIANSYTKYQQQAVNFQDLPIELWEVKKYTNSTILFNQLQSPQSSESIKTISKNKTITTVSSQVKKYSIDDHIKKDWVQTRSFYEELREEILSLKNTKEVFHKQYIAYKLSKNSQWLNFTEIACQAGGLKIYLDIKMSEIIDHDNVLISCLNVGHWATGSSFFKLTKEEDINYAMQLIKQVYEKINMK